ncbi:MAG: ATP-binding protein [Nostocaceae cyanobacterium]|nr:ATP-binding protein [Nostocaceae cyanobacterium]
MTTKPTLHFLCGKLASGKTTLARQIATENHAILISEDIWLSKLFPGEISSLSDYINYSSRFRNAIAPHAESLLRHGMSVVFDFAGNVPKHRSWVRSIFESADADHLLHYIIASDTLCKAQLRIRNELKPEGSQYTTEEEFDEITKYFVPPSSEEGFIVKEYDAERRYW